MAVKEFGASPEPPKNYIDEVYKLMGFEFPIEIESKDGVVFRIRYETEWKEGGTTPFETGKFYPDGNPILDYKESYKDRKLTAAQIKKLDAWIKEQISGK